MGCVVLTNYLVKFWKHIINKYGGCLTELVGGCSKNGIHEQNAMVHVNYTKKMSIINIPPPTVLFFSPPILKHVTSVPKIEC